MLHFCHAISKQIEVVVVIVLIDKQSIRLAIQSTSTIDYVMVFDKMKYYEALKDDIYVYTGSH